MPRERHRALRGSAGPGPRLLRAGFRDDSPEMTPALARVFAGIFCRLLSEERAGVVAANEGTAA